jgi:paraquat-inducible protein B
MRPAAWRVGALSLLGLALLGAALVWIGGRWFTPTERALMRFQTSVYGLQPGAPVVLRGVRVGWVDGIGLAADASGAVRLPVTATFDRAQLQALVDPVVPLSTVGHAASALPAGLSGGSASQNLLPALIARGLVARLASQSLLTGLLYVDLDFDPSQAGRMASAAGAAAAASPGVLSAAARDGSVTEIPTAAPAMHALRSGLEQIDLAQLGQDLSATAAALRRLLDNPRVADSFDRTAQAAEAVRDLATTLERELVPLARTTRAAAGDLRRVIEDLKPAAQAAAPALRSLEAASDRLGEAAGEVGTLARSGQPLVTDLRRTAEAMTAVADTARGAVAEDSDLRRRTDDALGEVSRAARALRELAELLEKHPSSILWGRPRQP